MKLKLTKPLVIIDLETTGLDIAKDRIIQIAYIKVLPDGTEQRKNIFVNPGRAILQDSKLCQKNLPLTLRDAISLDLILTISTYPYLQKSSCAQVWHSIFQKAA